MVGNICPTAPLSCGDSARARVCLFLFMRFNCRLPWDYGNGADGSYGEEVGLGASGRPVDRANIASLEKKINEGGDRDESVKSSLELMPCRTSTSLFICLLRRRRGRNVKKFAEIRHCVLSYFTKTKFEKGEKQFFFVKMCRFRQK